MCAGCVARTSPTLASPLGCPLVVSKAAIAAVQAATTAGLAVGRTLGDAGGRWTITQLAWLMHVSLPVEHLTSGPAGSLVVETLARRDCRRSLMADASRWLPCLDGFASAPSAFLAWWDHFPTAAKARHSRTLHRVDKGEARVCGFCGFISNYLCVESI